MKLIWSPLSIDRIIAIADYIARGNPTAATEWIEALFERVQRLDAYPFSGRPVPEINRKELREIIFGHYRIVYRILNNEIHILTVRHFKQQLPSTDMQM